LVLSVVWRNASDSRIAGTCATIASSDIIDGEVKT